MCQLEWAELNLLDSLSSVLRLELVTRKILGTFGESEAGDIF